MSKDERVLIEAIEMEYLQFKCSVLQLSNNEIFDLCNKIKFYSCVREFFLYNDSLKTEHIYLALSTPNVINQLYSLYLDNEFYDCSTWLNIEELLNAMLKRVQEKNQFRIA